MGLSSEGLASDLDESAEQGPTGADDLTGLLIYQPVGRGSENT
jgi:hypothetical protein